MNRRQFFGAPLGLLPLIAAPAAPTVPAAKAHVVNITVQGSLGSQVVFDALRKPIVYSDVRWIDP